MPLTAEGAALNAELIRNVLLHRATVYGRSSGGTFTVVLRADLACRLEQVSRQPAATSSQRRELAAMGSLRYDAEYTMPAVAQVEVDTLPGVRWNPLAATDWADDLPGIGPISRSVDVTRAL